MALRCTIQIILRATYFMQVICYLTWTIRWDPGEQRESWQDPGGNAVPILQGVLLLLIV